MKESGALWEQRFLDHSALQCGHWVNMGGEESTQFGA